jgi:hypothetical protein
MESLEEVQDDKCLGCPSTSKPKKTLRKISEIFQKD